MPTIAEIINQSQMQADLQVGMDTLSGSQSVTFTKYNRAILPLDGYVFWVRDVATAPIQVDGVLHYSADQKQNDDETIGINRVSFTTQNQIQDFNLQAESVVWIASQDEIRFAFTMRKNLFQQAGTYHYQGDAIYPVMFSQIIDNPASPLNLGGVISTNSLPIWLTLNQFMPIYPAMLVPSNLQGAYGVADISDTKAMQSYAQIDAQSNRYQLVSEKVKITVYNLNNNQVLDFVDYVLNYSLNYDTIGITNIPIPKDIKRGQSELGIRAQKKEIDFDVNYYQTRMQSIARKLILTAIPSYIFN